MEVQRNCVIRPVAAALAALCLGAAGTSLAQTCQSAAPVWSDEFDGAALDTTKWETMIGDGCDLGICGWGNNELEYYQAANAVVSNGTLKITAKKQRVKSRAYTSARLRTANMPNGGQWTNGRFEARIKLPNGAGMWPAFWMLPTNPDVGWPMSGEIDILEATGQADMIAFGTIHYGQPFPNNEWSSGRILKQPDRWSDDFHVYAVEWTPGEMRWYVDDILYSTKTPADLSDPAFWTFENHQYHFLLNLAVGGNIGGAVDDLALPATMEVDYVRVYDFGQPALAGPHITEPNASADYRIVGASGPTNFVSWTSPTGDISSTEMLTVNWGGVGGDVSASLSDACGAHEVSMNVHVSPLLGSEIILDDFGAARSLTYTSWTGSFNQNAANPGPDAVNSSSQVAFYIRSSAAQFDVIAADTSAIPDAAPFISGDKAFYLDVFTAAPVGTQILVQLENSAVATPSNFPSGRHSKYVAATVVENAWQRLKFKLDDRIDGATTDTQVDSVVLLLDPDSFNGDTYYLDNFEIYAASVVPGTPASISVASVVTGTAGAGGGQKYGAASVIVRDDLGSPAADVAVSGAFSGTWNESASATTDANGEARFQTSTTAGGKVTVNFCVASLAGALPHDTTASVGLCP